MAERIPFNAEEVRKEKNTRDFQKGDSVWFVPDPDEEGMVDQDDIHIYTVEAVGLKDSDTLFVRPADIRELPKKNLYLDDSDKGFTNGS